MSVPLTESLAKVKIEGFTDKDLTKSFRNNSFKALVNPDSFKEEISICYPSQGVVNNDGDDHIFSHVSPKNFDLSFLLDGTGALGIETKQKNYVWNLVQLFQHVTTYRATDESPTPYLKVSWGTMFIHCQLTKADIDYSMFSPNGVPIRASIKASFKTFSDESLQMKGSSSAITAAMKQGDSLAAKAASVYGSAGYAAALAKANGLTSPRALSSAKKINLPSATSLKRGG